MVRDRVDAHALRVDIRRGGAPRFSRITVEAEQLTSDEQSNFTRALERSYFACGCAESAAAGVLGLSAFVILVLARGIEKASWLDMVWALGVFFLSSGFGKFIGLRTARSRFLRTVSDLEQLLAKRGVPGHREDDLEAHCAVR
jgi:hypothetical protein